MQLANGISANLQLLDNPGLLNGKMGALIYLYHYSNYSDCSSYSDLADQQLSALFNMRNKLSLSLSDGMSGIGWGLHYLKREQFVEVDDDYLEEEEKVIFNAIRSIVNEDMLDCGLYFVCCRSKLLDEKMLSILSNQVTKLLSSGIHSLGVLNKMIALALRMPPQYIQQWYHLLNDAVIHAIEGKFFRQSDIIICNELINASEEIIADSTWNKEHDLCERVIKQRCLQKDFIESAWQYLVFLNGKIKSSCDMDWVSSIVDETFYDLNEKDMYLYGGLPAIGLYILMKDTM